MYNDSTCDEAQRERRFSDRSFDSSSEDDYETATYANDSANSRSSGGAHFMEKEEEDTLDDDVWAYRLSKRFVGHFSPSSRHAVMLSPPHTYANKHTKVGPALPPRSEYSLSYRRQQQQQQLSDYKDCEVTSTSTLKLSPMLPASCAPNADEDTPSADGALSPRPSSQHKEPPPVPQRKPRSLSATSDRPSSPSPTPISCAPSSVSSPSLLLSPTPSRSSSSSRSPKFSSSSSRLPSSPSAKRTPPARPLPAPPPSISPRSAALLLLPSPHYHGALTSPQAAVLIQRAYRGWACMRAHKKTLALQRYRAFVAKEILSSERTYVDTLSLTITKFLQPIYSHASTNSETHSDDLRVDLDDVKLMFGDIEVIHKINSEFLAKLEGRLQHWGPTQRLGDLFLDLSQYLKIYTIYVKNFDGALRRIADKLKVPKFQKFLSTLEEGEPCRKLEAFLITPVQRVPRYVLLLQDLLKHTEPAHCDYDPLAAALACIRDIASYINEKKRESDNGLKVVEIQALLTNKPPNLIAAQRRFCREGTLAVACRDAKKDKDKDKDKKFKKRHLFLFNDMLICTKPFHVPLFDNKRKYKYVRTIELHCAEVVVPDYDVVQEPDTAPGTPLSPRSAVTSRRYALVRAASSPLNMSTSSLPRQASGTFASAPPPDDASVQISEFELRTPTMTFTLAAESPAALQQWVLHIKAAIDEVKKHRREHEERATRIAMEKAKTARAIIMQQYTAMKVSEMRQNVSADPAHPARNSASPAPSVSCPSLFRSPPTSSAPAPRMSSSPVSPSPSSPPQINTAVYRSSDDGTRKYNTLSLQKLTYEERQRLAQSAERRTRRLRHEEQRLQMMLDSQNRDAQPVVPALHQPSLVGAPHPHVASLPLPLLPLVADLAKMLSVDVQPADHAIAATPADARRPALPKRKVTIPPLRTSASDVQDTSTGRARGHEVLSRPT